MNFTPFPAAAFRQFDTEGRLDGFVAASAWFELTPGGGELEVSRQPEFLWYDDFDGDPQTRPLAAQGDFVPEKPGADVTFLGDSFAPNGEARVWSAAIRIPGRIEHRLRVTGPRVWTASFRHRRSGFLGRTVTTEFAGWKLSPPEPARVVPLCWTRAAGGPTFGSPAGAPAHRDNPLGVGVLDERWADKSLTYPAPQITLPGEDLDARGGAATPAGFAPLAPWWGPRARYAGTYDERWRAERHPLLPRDFDPRFWQCATPALIVAPWLDGEETIVLENLHPRHPHLAVRLPGLKMTVIVYRRGETREEERLLGLDGVHFDFRRGAESCRLTFRARFPLDDADGARLVLRAFDRDFRLWRRKPTRIVGAETPA